MDASDKHLSTKKLRGKMEIEYCVSSTASSLFACIVASILVCLAVVHVSMRVFMCTYEGRGNQMDASNKHLSTEKLRGKMKIEFCVSSPASYVFVKRCRYT